MSYDDAFCGCYLMILQDNRWCNMWAMVIVHVHIVCAHAIDFARTQKCPMHLLLGLSIPTICDIPSCLPHVMLALDHIHLHPIWKVHSSNIVVTIK